MNSIKGLEISENPKNKFTSVSLHYSADPMKDVAWATQERTEMPTRRWNQEYELIWEVYEGSPVHPDFRTTSHVHASDVAHEVGLPIIRGWDFGLTPSVVIIQPVGLWVNVLDEIYEFDIGADRFSKLVFEYCNLNYPQVQWIDYGDPSAYTRSDVDESRVAEVIRRNSNGAVHLRQGARGVEVRLDAVDELLCRLVDGRPRLMFNPRCEWAIEAIGGGYHFPTRGKGRTSKQYRLPVKNDWSHVMDALQYACSMIVQRQQKVLAMRGRRIGRPSYGFQRPQMVSSMR